MYDSIEIPDELEYVVNRAIHQKQVVHKRINITSYMKGATVALATTFSLFIVLLNTNETFAKSMEEIPVISDLAKVFTVREYKEETDTELIEARVPAIQNTGNTELENRINNEISTKINNVLDEAKQRAKELDELIKLEGWSKARFKILQLLTKLRQICIDPSIIFDNYKGESAKIDELLKIVEETKANGHKMLIFTTYKKALDLIIPKLNNIGISSYYIDGSLSSKKRMELVEKFNNDNTDVFIITLKAGGTGLNLTSATVVIHLDLWWNPQTENQATDRAHRIGQKNTVEVIRLITKGTIEERILELQNKKRKLAELLIDNENSNENNFSKLTEDDIKMLLSMDNE